METGWTDTVRVVALSVQAVAVVVAAIWAYYKFARGRTFAFRAELTVTGSLLAAGHQRALQVTARFRNRGASRIPLRSKGVLAYRALPDAWEENKDLRWEEVGTGYMFAAHEALEPQETILDEILVKLPDDDAMGETPHAYRVECRVYAAKPKRAFTRRWRAVTRRWRHDPEHFGRWTARAVVPAKLQSSVNAERAANGAAPKIETTDEGGVT